VINSPTLPILAAALLFWSAAVASTQNYPADSRNEESEPVDEEVEAAEETEPDAPERLHGQGAFQVYDKFIRGNIDTSSVEVHMEHSGNVLFHIRCRRLEAIDPGALARILKTGAMGVPIPSTVVEKSADPFSKIQVEAGGLPESNRWMAIIRVKGGICHAVHGQREVDPSTGAQFFEGSISSSSVSMRQVFSNNRIILIDCEELPPGLTPTPLSAEELAALEKQLAPIEALAALDPKVGRPTRFSPTQSEKITHPAADSNQSAFNIFINRTANWAGGIFGESAYSDSALAASTKILDDWKGQILDESLDRSVTDSSRVDITMNQAANWQFLGASAQTGGQTPLAGTGLPELPPAEHILQRSLKNGGVFLREWTGELVDETIDGALMNQATAKIQLRDSANWLMAFSAAELLNDSLHQDAAFLSDWKGELIDEAVDGAVINGADASILLERTANWQLALTGSALLNDSLLAGSSLIGNWNGELIDESIDGEVRGNSSIQNRMIDTANWTTSLKGKEILCRSLQSAAGTNQPPALIANWNGELMDEILDGAIASGSNATISLKNSGNFHFGIKGETVLENALAGNATAIGHWEGELADEIIDGDIDNAVTSLELDGTGNWLFEVQAKQALDSALASTAAESPAHFLRRWEGELLDELLDGSSAHGSQARVTLRNSANFDFKIQAEEAFAKSFQGHAAFIREWEGELIDEIVDGTITDSSVDISLHQSANWNLSIQGKTLFDSAFQGSQNHLVEIWKGELLDEILDGDIASTQAPAQTKVRIVKNQSANWNLDIRASEAGFEEAFTAGAPNNSILGNWTGQLIDETLDGLVHGVPDLFLGSYESGNWELRLRLGQTKNLPPSFLRDHILGEWRGELVDELIDGESAADTPADDAILDSNISIENVRSGNWILDLESASRLDLDAGFLAHPFGDKWSGILVGDIIHGSVRNSKIRIRDFQCGNFILRAECDTLVLAEAEKTAPAGQTPAK
jgi:hypothetical protein